MMSVELPDDRTTEAGDASPRSVATGEQCEFPQTVKRTCWADLEDSDSDEDTCKDTVDESLRSVATDEECESAVTLNDHQWFHLSFALVEVYRPRLHVQCTPSGAGFVKMQCVELPDDRTTEASHATPRSVATDEQREIPQTIKRAFWADLEDSDSDEDSCKDDNSARNEHTNWADLEDSDVDQELDLKESSEKWKSESPALQGNEKSSTQAIKPDANVVERRINENDGKPYTKEEFLNWYGKKFGLKKWNASQQASSSLGNTEKSRRPYSAKLGRQFDKHQCQILVGIEEDQKFRVVRRVLGSGGENMKNIANDSAAKLRLRGRGSKFLEGPEQVESTDALMLCISALDKEGFEKAKSAASDLIKGIHQKYRDHCKNHGITCPQLRFDIHEGYRSGSR
jgi:hypothetical protein